ncbi:ASN_collapsed_G0044220.mRNA.1.CDS.1 [Saccharomyces cerevisiae]|nr:ASN_collapsed_G0044220.mRNA.1.CDS.1 [Saccharomyces cerevisiae]
MQYFRYPILPKSFLLVVGFSFKRRLPVLDVRECAYCVISDSRQEKKYSHARILENRIMEIPSLKDGDKEK